MLKVDVNGLFESIFESINSFLIFSTFSSLFKLILQPSVGILEFKVFAQQGCIELVIDFIEFVDFLFEFLIFAFVVCEFVCGFLKFLGFLVVRGKEFLVLLFQLCVRDVGEACGLVSSRFVLHGSTALLLWVVCFTSFIVAVEVFCYGIWYRGWVWLDPFNL